VDKAPDAFRTISEVAQDLDVPQHVLRFWETRFPQIRPMKRAGGRRYYRPDDVDLVRGIRHLLYGEGYTIRGVQRILRDHGTRFVQTIWQASAESVPPTGDDAAPVEGAGSPVTGGRKLFGLLPSRTGVDAERDAEPLLGQGVLAAEPMPNVVPADRADAQGAALARADVERLQAALSELVECRRILDVALGAQG
jgi:DNA-binding transcriptional MerR regulator